MVKDEKNTRRQRAEASPTSRTAKLGRGAACFPATCLPKIATSPSHGRPRLAIIAYCLGTRLPEETQRPPSHEAPAVKPCRGNTRPIGRGNSHSCQRSRPAALEINPAVCRGGPSSERVILAAPGPISRWLSESRRSEWDRPPYGIGGQEAGRCFGPMPYH